SGPFVADENEGRAVGRAGRAARRVGVLDPLEPVIARHGDRVEAGLLAGLGERRGEPGEEAGGGVEPGGFQPLAARNRSDPLVVVKHRQAVVVHRDDRLVEPAVRPRLGGSLPGPGGVAVEIIPAQSPDGRQQVGGDSGRDVARQVVRRRVVGPRAAVDTRGQPGHRLDAAREHQLVAGRAHPPGGQVDRLQRGRADPVDDEAADVVGQPGDQRGRAGEVAALVAERGGDAEDEVGQPVDVQRRVAFAYLVDQPGDERHRLDAVQRPAGTAAAAGRADRVEDDRLGGTGRGHAATVPPWLVRAVTRVTYPASGTQPGRGQGADYTAAVAARFSRKAIVWATTARQLGFASTWWPPGTATSWARGAVRVVIRT